jgi:hypothetical protein
MLSFLGMQKMSDENKMSEYKKMINLKQCFEKRSAQDVNNLYYIFQTGGTIILIISGGLNKNYFVFFGVLMNIFASIIHIYLVNDILKKLSSQMKAIRQVINIEDGDIEKNIEEEGNSDSLTSPLLSKQESEN